MNKVFLLLMVIVGLGSCTSKTDPETEIERIRGLIERTQVMNNDGDVEGWVALFEDGAIYMPPGQAAVTTGHPRAARA